MKDIDHIHSLLTGGSSDHIMVSKDMVLALISAFGTEQVRQVLDKEWANFVPDPDDLLIDDKWFRAKVALISRSLDVTQSTLAAKAKIDQGDFSKFEAGIKLFGPQRREKIVTALKELRDEKHRASAPPAP